MSEQAGAVRQHSVYDINLDSYYTRHLTSYFSIELAQPFQIDVMVGNKEVLQSTHTYGLLRLVEYCF